MKHCLDNSPKSSLPNLVFKKVYLDSGVFAFSINEVEVVESVWETVQLYLGALLGPTVPCDAPPRFGRVL